MNHASSEHERGSNTDLNKMSSINTELNKGDPQLKQLVIENNVKVTTIIIIIVITITLKTKITPYFGAKFQN